MRERQLVIEAEERTAQHELRADQRRAAPSSQGSAPRPRPSASSAATSGSTPTVTQPRRLGRLAQEERRGVEGA